MRHLFLATLLLAVVSSTQAQSETVRIDGGSISGVLDRGIRVFKGVPFEPYLEFGPVIQTGTRLLKRELDFQEKAQAKPRS